MTTLNELINELPLLSPADLIARHPAPWHLGDGEDAAHWIILDGNEQAVLSLSCGSRPHDYAFGRSLCRLVNQISP